MRKIVQVELWLDFISANWNWTVSKALSKFREQVEEVDQVYTIYVVTQNKDLKGPFSKSFYMPQTIH